MESTGSRVRILAFGSEDCVQCQRLHTPVLRRVLAEHKGAVSVIDVYAPDSPELTEREGALTLPRATVDAV